MSRVINHETAGKERRQLMRLIAYAIRELNLQLEVTSETRDLAAFIALSLIAIHDTIDRSVEPWEKRGYWIKADRYRMEWAWTLKYGNQMKDSVLSNDWGYVAFTAVGIAEKLGVIKLPTHNKNGHFWVGSYNNLVQKVNTN